ncbi:MAG: mechanosensitive ion channel, partial [Acidimicrobiaceae bacterium]|nr:mechanosensitive ion channel [Acidimicrobiaceae bacterium]
MLIFAQTSTSTGLADACGTSNRGFVCEQVYNWTESDGLATAADWLLDRPIRIALILLVAWFIARVAKRAIVRFTKRIAATPSSSRLQKLREKGPGRALIDEAERSRAEARAETLGHVLRSVVVSLVWGFTAMIILGEIGVNLGPLIAGAGIGGVALGFGAQSIVKDFLSGLFMLIEDHYGVGDFVDLGYASGTVEEVSLRSTTIRDVRGTVWHVPNGEIARVGN